MSGLLFLHQSRGSLLAHAIFSDVVPVLFMRDLDCLPVAFCSKIEVFLHVSVFLGGGGDVFYTIDFLYFSPEEWHIFVQFGIGPLFGCCDQPLRDQFVTGLYLCSMCRCHSGGLNILEQIFLAILS